MELSGQNLEPTFHELRAWCSVAEQKSFLKAGKELGLKTASVHSLVANLGEKVKVLCGSDLYDYNAKSREIVPSEIGLKLAERARAAVRTVQDARSFLKGLQSADHSVRVAATLGPLNDWIIPALSSIREKYPGLAVELLTRGSSGALELVRDRRCHIALAVAEAFRKDDFPERFEARPLRTLGVYLLVPRGHPLASLPGFLEAHQVVKSAEEGDRWRDACKKVLHAITEAGGLILPARGGAFRDRVEQVFHKHNVRLPPFIQEFDTSYTILSAVAHKLGIAIQQEPPVSVYEGPRIERFVLSRLFGEWKVVAVFDPLLLTVPAKDLLAALPGEADEPAGPQGPEAGQPVAEEGQRGRKAKKRRAR
jgi:DNA-binding transcriptional LysR family regulator